MKQCNAFVKKTNAQCKNKSLFGSNYCFSHYPKKEAIFTIIVSFVLSVIFSDPLTHYLSKLPTLYFLDKNKPIVESIIPDIKKSPTVEKNTKAFKVKYSDKDSGLDLVNSYVNIKYKTGEEYKPVEGKFEKTNSELSFNVQKELEYGEYLFDALLVDKARNNTEILEKFVIKEKGGLGFGINCYKFEKYEHQDTFNTFFESEAGKDKEFIKLYNFYVYIFNVFNPNSKVILKNAYLTINTGEIIFDIKEIRNYLVRGIKTFNILETLNKELPAGHMFSSDGLLNIDEIAPQSLLGFAILVGVNKGLPRNLDGFKNKTLRINGVYSYDGYGVSELKEIDVVLPIEEVK